MGPEFRHLFWLNAQHMIRDQIPGFLKPEGGNQVQDLPLAGDQGRQDIIKGRNPVAGDDQQPAVDFEHIAHFSPFE